MKVVKIVNGDMVRYAKELGEYLMTAKLSIMDHQEQNGDGKLSEFIDMINYVENELKAWSEDS